MDFFGKLDRASAKKQTILKAPFGWAGGKTRILDFLIPLIPNTNTFVDVFGGSGVVLFNKQRVQNEVYNDANSGVVFYYRCLRDPIKHADLS